jgi:hypothetical protein
MPKRKKPRGKLESSVADGNGKPVGIEQGSGGPKYTLTITWDVATESFDVTGLNVPAWASLGMLRYMEILVRRREVENVMAAMAAGTPRIAVPGGPF